MPDFSVLLKKLAGEAKRPPILPPDDYPGVVKSFEYGDNNEKKTPYVRFHLALTDWGAACPEDWTVWDPATNKSYTVTKSDVDLSKKQMRRDFFLTEEAFYRLDVFLRSCGIDPQGKTYEEVIPNVVGSPVLVQVQQQLNQKSNDTYNQVGGLVGQSS